MMSAKQFPALADLETLVAVIDEGGVTAAARRLGETQPVVSQRIAQLRDEFGLLVRDGKRLVPTPRAWQVLPSIRQLLRQHQLVRAQLLHEGEACGIVRLGVGTFAAEHYLPELLAVFAPPDGAWRLEARVTRGEERIVGVAKGHLDAAIVTHDRLQIDALARAACGVEIELDVEPLVKHRLCLVAVRDSVHAQELLRVPTDKPFPVDQLPRLKLVGLSPDAGVRRQIERRLAGRAALCYVAEGAGWHAAKACARKGLGAAVLPLETLVPGDERSFVVRRLSDTIAVQDQLIYRKGDDHEGRRLVCRHVKQVAAALNKQALEYWQ